MCSKDSWLVRRHSQYFSVCFGEAYLHSYWQFPFRLFTSFFSAPKILFPPAVWRRTCYGRGPQNENFSFELTVFFFKSTDIAISPARENIVVQIVQFQWTFQRKIIQESLSRLLSPVLLFEIASPLGAVSRFFALEVTWVRDAPITGYPGCITTC